MLTHAQFQALLVDYLYGLLEGEALADFEDSLQKSADYRAELEALRKTLAVTRVALVGPLAEPAPERARRAVIAAARAAAESAPAAGFWAFVRKPWALPAFGMAAACALALVIVRQVGPDGAAPIVPALPLPPAEAPSASESAAEPADPTFPPADPFPASPRAESSGARNAPRGGIGSAPKGRAPSVRPSPSRLPQRSLGPDEHASDHRVAKGEAPALGRSAGTTAPMDEGTRADRRPVEERKRSSAGASDRAHEAWGEAEAEAPAAAPAAAAPAAAAPAPAPAPAAASAPVSPAKAAATEADEARERLVQRAGAALAEKKFGEAATLYRSLLARFPDDVRAPAWRTALRAALGALDASLRD